VAEGYKTGINIKGASQNTDGFCPFHFTIDKGNFIKRNKHTSQ